MADDLPASPYQPLHRSDAEEINGLLRYFWSAGQATAQPFRRRQAVADIMGCIKPVVSLTWYSSILTRRPPRPSLATCRTSRSRPSHKHALLSSD
jgi:hypothetical protein